MVTARQWTEIRKRMRAIKDLRDSGGHEDEIKRMTQDLHSYLLREGLIEDDEF